MTQISLIFFFFLFSFRFALLLRKKSLVRFSQILTRYARLFFRQNDRRTFFSFLTYALLCRWHISAKKRQIGYDLRSCGHSNRVSLLCITSSRFKLNSKLYMKSNCFGFKPLYSNPNRNNTIFFLSMSGLDLFAGNDVATTRARFTSFV